MSEYKKAEDKSETRYLLEDAKIFPDHVRGRIGGFDVKFTKSKITAEVNIVAEVSYKDAKIRIYEHDDKKGVKEVVLPSIKFYFYHYLSTPSMTVDGDILEARVLVSPVAEFTRDGKEEAYETLRKKDGGLERLWFDTGKRMTLDAGLSRKLNSDFALFSKALSLVLESDPNVRPFKEGISIKLGEYKMGRELLVRLADKAEKIAQENKLGEKPEALFPLLMQAKDAGILSLLHYELYSRNMHEADDEAGRKAIENRLAVQKILTSFLLDKDRLNDLITAWKAESAEEK